nr:MAG TPA: hypothetical protein [Caudoviricetes sp.]
MLLCYCGFKRKEKELFNHSQHFVLNGKSLLKALFYRAFLLPKTRQDSEKISRKSLKLVF